MDHLPPQPPEKVALNAKEDKGEVVHFELVPVAQADAREKELKEELAKKFLGQTINVFRTQRV